MARKQTKAPPKETFEQPTPVLEGSAPLAINDATTSGDEARDPYNPLQQTQYKPRLQPAMVDKMWQPGVSGNPGGRPKGSRSLKELLQAVPVERKAQLVEHMYRNALDSSSATAAKWAELILTQSGEGASFKLEMSADDGPWMQVMMSMREKLTALAQPVVEGEAKLLDASN